MFSNSCGTVTRCDCGADPPNCVNESPARPARWTVTRTASSGATVEISSGVRIHAPVDSAGGTANTLHLPEEGRPNKPGSAALLLSRVRCS